MAEVQDIIYRMNNFQVEEKIKIFVDLVRSNMDTQEASNSSQPIHFQGSQAILFVHCMEPYRHDEYMKANANSLKKQFPDLKFRMCHKNIHETERNIIMEKFKDGRCQFLLATLDYLQDQDFKIFIDDQMKIKNLLIGM